MLASSELPEDGKLLFGQWQGEDGLEHDDPRLPRVERFEEGSEQFYIEYRIQDGQLGDSSIRVIAALVQPSVVSGLSQSRLVTGQVEGTTQFLADGGQATDSPYGDPTLMTPYGELPYLPSGNPGRLENDGEARHGMDR